MSTDDFMKELKGRGAAPKRRVSAEDRRSEEALRNIRENFRYLTAILNLQGGLPPVKRMKSFKGPLPGIYPHRTR